MARPSGSLIILACALICLAASPAAAGPRRGTASPSRSAADQLDDPGEWSDRARDLANDLLPVVPLTPADGYLMTADLPVFAELPTVNPDTASAVGLDAGDIALTHKVAFSGLANTVSIQLEVAFVEVPGLAERYVERRLLDDGAVPTERITNYPAALIEPEGGLSARTVVAANGPLLVTAVGLYGDGGPVDLEWLGRYLQTFVAKQLPLEGTGEWERVPALLQAGLADFQGTGATLEAIGGFMGSFPSLIIGVAVSLKIWATLKNPPSRRRLAARLHLRPKPHVPPRFDHVDTSEVSRRRRRASWGFTMRRWILGWLFFMILAVLAILLSGLRGDGGHTPTAVGFGSPFALCVAWFVAGRLLRFWADRGTPQLSRMDARPPGYGALRAKTWAFAAVLVVTTTMAGLGVLITVAGLFGNALADAEMNELEPTAPLLDDAWIAAVLGLALVALATRPANWLRSRRNQQLSLAAADDTRSTILLLRSFGDDHIKMTRELRQQIGLTDRLNFASQVAYEDAVVRRLWLSGAVVAVGEPGNEPPPLGATRTFLGDDWVTSVRLAIDSSAVIAMSLGTTEGVRWELQQIDNAGAVGRSIFIVPPTKDAAQRIALLCSTLSVVNPPAPTATPVTIVVDPSSRLATYFCDDYRTESAYAAALDHAVFEALQWRPERAHPLGVGQVAATLGCTQTVGGEPGRVSHPGRHEPVDPESEDPIGVEGPSPNFEPALLIVPSERFNGDSEPIAQASNPLSAPQSLPPPQLTPTPLAAEPSKPICYLPDPSKAKSPRPARRKRKLPKLGIAGVIALFALSPASKAAIGLLSANDATFTLTGESPRVTYGSTFGVHEPTVVWGPDYMWRAQADYYVEKIRPLSVDYSPTADSFGMVERDGTLSVLNAADGRTEAATHIPTDGDKTGVELSYGQDSVAWFGDSLVVLQPMSRRLTVWDPVDGFSQIDLGFIPLGVITAPDGGLVVSDAHGGLHVFDARGEQAAFLPTDFPIMSLNWVGERLVIAELIDGRSFEVDLASVAKQAIASRAGMVLPLGEDSFLIYDGRTYLQYAGDPFIPTRRTSAPEGQGLLTRVDDFVIHIADDGTQTFNPICGGLLCTQAELGERTHSGR
ncbi:MAG: hypothetical protein KDB86_00955 [Actinobacteria bacterium]|nr:hypothetical protein [Actinomycetota bacterium]